MGMMGFVALAAPLADTLGLLPWQIGLSATAGGLGWVLTARAWGRAADTLGRKQVLVAGLAGFTVAYFALCLVAQAGASWGLGTALTLGGLVVARFAAGLAYSALPAAGGALIADHFRAEVRAGAMGKLGAAQAGGMLLGPAAVVLMAGPSPVLPLFLLAVIQVFALAYLWFRLPSDSKASAGIAPPLPLTDPRLIRPFAVAFCAMVAIGTAQIVVGFAALDRLGLAGPGATRVAGLALASVAVALILAQMVVGRLGWQPRRLMLTGGLIAAIGIGFAGFAPNAVGLVLAYALGGFGAGWVMPAINAAAANAVDADEQGRAAGAVSTALGIGAMVGPLVGGALYGLGHILPFLAGALFLAAAALIGARIRDRNSTSTGC